MLTSRVRKGAACSSGAFHSGRWLSLLAPLLLAACKTPSYVPPIGDPPEMRRTVEAGFSETMGAIGALFEDGEIEIPSMRIAAAEVETFDAERGEVCGFLEVAFREGLEQPEDYLEQFAAFGVLRRGRSEWAAGPALMTPKTPWRTASVRYGLRVQSLGPDAQEISMRTEWSGMIITAAGFLGDAFYVVTGLSTGAMEEDVLAQIARRLEIR